MPLTVTQQPDQFTSAYMPMLVKVTSSRYPINNTLGESNIPVIEIRVADATDVATYGAPLSVGDVFVEHTPTSGTAWVVGDQVRIFATGTGEYDSIFRVTGTISGNITIIDAEDKGQSFGGVIGKHYQSYNIIAQAITENSAEVVKYRLTADPDGVFTLDMGPLCRRTFKDVFQIAESGQPVEFIPANGYITQSWRVTFSEAYMIFDADTGVGTYTELDKSGDTLSLASKIAVNSVQPYANESAGHYWEDGLDDYIVNPITGGAKRFLTYGPRGGGSTFNLDTAQRVASGEDFWLAFLWTGGPTLEMRVASFNAAGTQLTLNDVDFSITDADSYIFNVSPDALSAYISPSASHYQIQFRNNSTGVYSERFYLKVAEPCQTAQRFYFLNGMGGIDQYTVEGRDTRDTQIRRSTVEKPHMELTLPNAGDWQRRTYAVEIKRRYSAQTRTERKEIARWLLDEFFESVDVRALSYDGNAAYTYAILEAQNPAVGPRGTKFDITWSYGTDNRKQRR